MVCEASRDIMRQSGLAHHDRKQRTVDALEMPDQIGFDLVANQADRSPLA